MSSFNLILFAMTFFLLINFNLTLMLLNWAKQWQLDISIPQTFILHLGSNNPKLPYFIDGRLLSSVDCIKDLGVYVTPNLSWHSHCINTTKKANFIANSVLRSFKCTDVFIYMSAFKCYVLPILEYYSFVWNPSSICDIKLVENVQKYLQGVSLKDVTT